MRQLNYKDRKLVAPITIGLYVLYLIVWHIYIAKHLDFGDSVDYFSEKSINWSFLIERYNQWSSRLLIEIPLISLSKYPIAFLAINFIIMGIFPFIVWSLFKRFTLLEEKVWLILILFMLYPLKEMNSAGWIATMANYYYPLVFGVLSLFLISEENLSINWTRYLTYNLCLLLACNIEQLCLIFVPLYIFLAYSSRLYRYYSLPVLLTIGSLLFIILSPGNHSRSLFSTFEYLPDFVNYSLEYKIYMGFQATIFRYITTINLPFIAFLVTLLYCTYQKKGKTLAFVPLLCLFIIPFCGIEQKYVPTAFESRDSSLWHGYAFFSISVYLSLHIISSIYDLCDDNKSPALTIIGILFLGFCARFVMGLSPTLFASNSRTFIFTDFAIIFATLLLLALFPKVKKQSSSI